MAPVGPRKPEDDPKDAQIILHMLRIGAVRRHHDPLAHGLVDVQELSKTHDMVSRAKTELWHRLLTHCLPLCFPEAERFRGNARSDGFLAFLEAFPTPATIAVLDKEAFIAAAWDVVGRKVSKRRLLEDVYETARSSIGPPVPPSSEAVAMFRMVLAEGRGLIRQRDAIERRAEEPLAHDADHQRLRTMPGVGPINAPTILAEAGDLRRFRHHRRFLKLGRARPRPPPVGHLPRPDSAVEVRRRPTAAHLSRIAGPVAIRQRDNGFRDKFERCVARDRSSADRRRKALAAIAAKMARDLARHRQGRRRPPPVLRSGGTRREDPSPLEPSGRQAIP